MAQLTKPRNTPERRGDVFDYPIASGVIIYAGALVALSATGYAIPGKTATGLTALGRAEETIDNTGGTDGAVPVRVRRGIFAFGNLDADKIAQAQTGTDCYIADDQTVAKSSTGRSRAGKVVAVDHDGVWVQIGIGY